MKLYIVSNTMADGEELIMITYFYKKALRTFIKFNADNIYCVQAGKELKIAF